MAKETGGVTISMPVAMIFAGFFAISFYNFIYINIKIFITFKHYRGLYFWSLIIASCGIPVHTTGVLLGTFQLGGPKLVGLILAISGWYCMVTGQSVVQYSRLYLVVKDRRKIRWVLMMIIVDFFLFHIVITVLCFGANSSNPGPFKTPFKVYEKIQVTGFAIQECIISGLYIRETWRMLKPAMDVRGQRARRIIMHLIAVNIIIIIMDITLLCTEYANLYAVQTTYKGALYSIKLVMEFSILNHLFAMVQGNSQSSSGLTTRSYRNAPFSSVDGQYGVAVSSAKPVARNNDSGREIELSDNCRGIVKATELAVEHRADSFKGGLKLGKGMEVQTRQVRQEEGRANDGNQDNIVIDMESDNIDLNSRRSLTPTSSEVHFARQGW